MSEEKKSLPISELKLPKNPRIIASEKIGRTSANLEGVKRATFTRGQAFMEGQVLDYKLKSQKVWYKPWTWHRKPIKILTKVQLLGVSMVAPPRDERTDRR